MAAKQNTPTLVRGVLQKLKVRIGQSGNLNMEEAYGSNSISYTLRDYNASSATFQMVGTHGKYVPIVAIREGFNLYASIGYTNMGKKKKSAVSSVSFQVFDMERLLFRAEWAEEPKYMARAAAKRAGYYVGDSLEEYNKKPIKPKTAITIGIKIYMSICINSVVD